MSLDGLRTRLRKPLSGSARTHGLRWLSRGIAALLLLVIVSDIIGVLLTIWPKTVKWEQIPTSGFPPGPPFSITALAAEPGGSFILAGTDGGGVFRSSDGGDHWSISNEGLWGMTVVALAIGNDGKTAYVATKGGGIFRSDDGGMNWSFAGAGVTDLEVRAIGIQPDGAYALAGTSAGIYRSEDKGVTWQAVGQGLTNSSVLALAVAPSGQFAIAGTERGVFRSTDGGRSWHIMGNNSSTLVGSHLIVFPDNSTALVGNQDGLFITHDLGQTWQALDIGNGTTIILGPSGVSAMVMWQDGKRALVAHSSGVYLLDDLQTGKLVPWGANRTGLHSLAIDTTTGRVLAGTDTGILRSSGGDQDWLSCSDGLSRLPVTSVALSPVDSDLYVSTEGGVFNSNDVGRSWRPDNMGLGAQQANHLAVGIDGFAMLVAPPYSLWNLDIAAGTQVLLEARPVITPSVRMFNWFRFVVPWNTHASEPTEPLVQRQGESRIIVELPGISNPDQAVQTLKSTGQLEFVEIGPSSPSSVLANVLDGVYVRTRAEGQSRKITFASTAASRSNLFRLDPGQDIWRSVGIQATSSVSYISFELFKNNIIAWSSQIIYTSTDGGLTWQIVKLAPDGTSVQGVAVTPDGHRCFAATTKGLYVSETCGNIWEPVKGELGSVPCREVVVSPDGSGIGVLNSKGVFWSVDGGDSWAPTDEKIAPQVRKAFAYHLSDGSLVLVWPGADVPPLRSDDGGKTWRQSARGLGNTNILTVVVTPDRQGLIVGTANGVYRSTDHGRKWQSENEGLSGMVVRELIASGEPVSLYARTDSGVQFRSDDGGFSWRETVEWPTQPISQTSTSYLVESTLENGISTYSISVSRLGTSWLPWLTIPDEAPKDIIEQEGNRARLFAVSGAVTLLRMDAPLPVIWRAPTPYVVMVAATIRGLEWGRANAKPISTCLLVLLVLYSAVVFGIIARPNRIRPTTAIWMFAHPRYLLAASSHQGYSRRWEMGSVLERLISLLVPSEDPTTLQQFADRLGDLGAVSTTNDLRSSLDALQERGLVIATSSGWQLAEPLAAAVLHRELAPGTASQLAEQTRLEHPLHQAGQRFLKQAGVGSTFVPGTPFYRCQTETPQLLCVLPSVFYVSFLPELELDSAEALAIRDKVKILDPETPLVLVFSDKRPTDEGWAQIGTLRMQSFTLLPIESTFVYTGLADKRGARVYFQEAIADRLGDRQDPYDFRRPVAGVLSFFGRQNHIDNMLRGMANGSHFGVFGLRKMGKSSLIKALQDRAPFPIAYVDCGQFDGGRDVTPLYRPILEEWQRWSRVRYQVNWGLPSITETNPTEWFVSATYSLLAAIQSVHDSAKLGIAFDEIELLVPRPDGTGPDRARYLTLMRALRGLSEGTGRIAIVVTSLNPSVVRINAWDGEQNPLFSYLSDVPLGPLDEDDCNQMIRSIGRQVGLVYDDESVHRIYSLAGGHPFLARQLCSLLYKAHTPSEAPINLNDVAAGAQRFIYQMVEHLDNNIWQDIGSVALWNADGARANQSLLRELARSDGPVSQEDLLRGKSVGKKRESLFNLERYCVLKQSEPGFYEIRFGLLRAWLRQRVLGLEIA